MLRGDLHGKKILKKKRAICIHTADSLCCTAETNTALQLYSNEIFFKNLGIRNLVDKTET